MAKKNNSHTVYRDKRTGELAPKEKAKANPSKYTKEQMPNPGHGDTGR